MLYLTPEHEAIFKRTEAWLAAAGAVGQLEEALSAAANEQNIDVRVIARDGERFLLRTSFSPCRINVEVADGRVTRVDGVY